MTRSARPDWAARLSHDVCDLRNENASATGRPDRRLQRWSDSRPPDSSRIRRVRVLFCIDGMGRGGTELNALRVAQRLDPSKIDLKIVCWRSDGPLLNEYRAAGISVVALDRVLGPGASIARNVGALFGLLRDFSPHVVHSHDRYNNAFATLAARALRVPMVVTSRRWWDWRSRRSHAWANRLAYALSDYVVANSETIADVLVHQERVSRRRVLVLPNFVEEDAFRPPSDAARIRMRREFDVRDEDIVIGCVANLSPVKDHRTQIAAFASLADRYAGINLVLVGAGPCRPELEHYVRTLGLGPRIRFVGARPNRPNLHHLFDISVLTSTSEGLPNSVVEAMAAARPVVATGVGAVADAVVHGQTGLIVGPRDPMALAAALDTLIVEPSLRERLGQAGASRARRLYHESAVIPEIASFYQRAAPSA